jgi:hypothetical protein
LTAVAAPGSELAGALPFGRLARGTTDSELAVFLTEHFGEEARHAWLWTDTLRRPCPWNSTSAFLERIKSVADMIGVVESKLRAG